MKRLRRLFAVLVAVLVAVVVTACGGGDQTTTTSAPAAQSPSGGGGASPQRALGDLPPAFVKCMADQGFQIKQEFDIHSAPPAALQACFGTLHG